MRGWIRLGSILSRRNRRRNWGSFSEVVGERQVAGSPSFSFRGIDIEILWVILYASMKEPLSIPSGLFRSSNLPAHHNDRYAVYKMLNRIVTCRDPGSGTKVSGCIEQVYRDIFAGEIQITVRGQTFRFKEPTTVRMDGNDVVFVYGDAKKQEVSDKTLFKELRRRQFKETVTDTISRITPCKVREKRFVLGIKKASRRKPFLMSRFPVNIAIAACSM